MTGASHHAPSAPRCIFCASDEALVVARGPLSYVVLNLYPYNNGHLMVVPNRHVGTLADATPEELSELMRFTRDATGAWGYSDTDFRPIDGELMGSGQYTPNRNFTLDLDGRFTYKACTGQFVEFAGDGDAMVYVDGKLVVDNRGQHGKSEQSGELYLTAGQHAIEVTYFEHLGDNGLELSWSGPGFERRALSFEAR